MADRARCDLPYGHFGRGIYSPDDQSWQFDRNLSFSSTTQLLREPKILSKSSPSPLDSNRGAQEEGPPPKRHTDEVKNLVESSTHLRPASGILLPLLRVSEAAQHAVHRYDAIKGSLIANGDIHSYSRNRSIAVTAYVSGKTGCDLTIVQVQKQKQGWDDERHSWLEVPTLHGEQAVWFSRGGPIQQAHFASNIQTGPALLAVRLLTRTTIIRTVQVRTPSEERSSISTKVLYDVDIKQTGDRTHVDVAFNPWFMQQVALVDCTGNWTVLEFSTRNMDRVARSWSNVAQKPSAEACSSISDGWARISWVLNLGTLAVCTRDSLKLFSIVDEDPVMIDEVELGLSGSVPWVLDFLVLPGRSNYFCVLTSTHVLIYHLMDTTTSKTQAIIKFRIRHYKNPEDLSLRLTAWTEHDEEGVGILIYSSGAGLTSKYRITLSDAHSSVTVDHVDLNMLMGPSISSKPGSLVSIQVRRIELAQKPNAKVLEHQLETACFFSALLLCEDQGVCQTLFCVGSDNEIPPLAWEAKLASSSFRMSRRNFIAEDSTPGIDEHARHRVEPFARRSRQAKLQGFPGDNSVNLEQVASLLQLPTEVTEPFADVLSSIKSELRRSDLDASYPLRTLYSFAQAELGIADVEHCSVALEKLLDMHDVQANEPLGPLLEAGEHGHQLALASITLPPASELGELGLDSGLTSAHDRMLAIWVTSLADTIPGRTRLARARLCGVVAVQLVLSSRSLRIQELPDSQPSQEQTQPETQSQDSHAHKVDFSDHRHGGNRGFALSQLDSSQPFQSSALPTPSQTPSITTASSRPSTFAAPELSRLSKYTTFDKPTPPALPRSLSNVLSHWKVGEDIQNYDWMSTSRSIAQQDEEADDEMTEADRRRAQRRAERHMRRQRKQAAASQAQQLASSQAPEIFSASQPAGLKIESQPSGIAGSSQVTGFATGVAAASQVEAGRFGGRAKKRRRQGF